MDSNEDLVATWIATDPDLPALADQLAKVALRDRLASDERIEDRLLPVPPAVAGERAPCVMCRRPAPPVGRIGLRLVFEHCGVHFFRPPRRRPRASVRLHRIEVAHLMRVSL